jgi:ribonuclease P protein component
MSELQSEGNSLETKRFRLPKSERLCSEVLIQELFQKGSSLFLYPFKLAYRHSEKVNSAFPQVLFSVSKKNFKKSVDRNRIRRQIKEIYRHHKSLVPCQKEQAPNVLAIIFVGKKHEPFDFMSQRLSSLLRKLAATT